MTAPADEKLPLYEAALPATTTAPAPGPAPHQPTAEMMLETRRSRRHRFQAAALVILLSLFFLARQFQCDDPTHDHNVLPLKAKVPLEAHIMSKCPDARDCLRDLIIPTMEKVSDRVDFKLSYIGKITSHDEGVRCMHGETECLGNMLELCAADLHPDPKIHLGFAMCLSRDYRQIPARALVHDCALEHGIDFAALNTCVSRDDGAYAIGLLRDSVQRSADVNVSTSCTVRLADRVRCVRDGGQWKNCPGGSAPEDLAREIEKLYEEQMPVGWSD